MIEAAIIIEFDGYRVLSEVEWPERTQQILVRSRLIDDQGQPLPQVEGEAPVENTHAIFLSPNPDYSEEQLTYDVETARFARARELAGKTIVGGLREKVGLHQNDPTAVPSVVTSPSVARPT